MKIDFPNNAMKNDLFTLGLGCESPLRYNFNVASKYLVKSERNRATEVEGWRGGVIQRERERQQQDRMRGMFDVTIMRLLASKFI